MADELTYPVAHCPNCDESGPMVVSDFPSEDFEAEFVAVYCPGCEEVINFDRNVKVEWYTADEISKVTGWRLVDGK